MGYGIDLDPASEREVRRMLRGIPAAVPKVMQKAVATTAKNAGVDVSAEVRKVVTLKATSIKSRVRVTKFPSTADPSARIGLAGEAPLLSSFGKPNETKRNGVSIRVRRDGPRERHRKAFVRSGRGGSNLVLVRSAKPDQPVARRPRRGDEIVGRKKVFALRGPAVSQIYDKEPGISERVNDRFLVRLEKATLKQVDNLLRRETRRASASLQSAVDTGVRNFIRGVTR